MKNTATNSTSSTSGVSSHQLNQSSQEKKKHSVDGEKKKKKSSEKTEKKTEKKQNGIKETKASGIKETKASGIKETKASDETKMLDIDLPEAVDSKSDKPKVISKPKRNVASLVSDFTLDLLLTVPGQIIRGGASNTDGCLLQLAEDSKPIPPRADLLRLIQEDEFQASLLTTRLASIPHLREIPKEKRLDWLISKGTESGDTDMADLPGIRVRVLSLGSCQLAKEASAEDIQRLMESDSVPMKDIRKMIPLTAEQKGRAEELKKRHTLFCLRSWWQPAVNFELPLEFEGPVLDVAAGSIEAKRSIKLPDNKTQRLYLVGKPDERLGILAPVTARPVQLPSLIDAIVLRYGLETMDRGTREDVMRFFAMLHTSETLTMSGWKSLVQKCMRFGALNLRMPSGRLVPMDFVFALAFAYLVTHSGSLVPDEGRFCTGAESGLKRLLVTLFEDGAVAEEDLPLAASLAASAYLVHMVPIYKPGLDLVLSAIELGIKSLKSSVYFTYKTDPSVADEVKLPALADCKSPMQVVARLVQTIGSFSGDCMLLRYLSSPKRRASSTKNKQCTPPNWMPIEHCFDQHWVPSVVNCFDLETLKDAVQPGGKPFSKLFHRLFKECTGVNWRHRTVVSDEFEQRPFVKLVRDAQRSMLMARGPAPTRVKDSREVEDGKESKDGKDGKDTKDSKDTKEDRMESLPPLILPTSWLAAMVGMLKVSGARQAHLHYQEPHRLMALRQPGKAKKKTAELSTEERRSACNILRLRLQEDAKKPIRLGQYGVKPPVAAWDRAIVSYDGATGEEEGSFRIRLEDGSPAKTWEELRQIEIRQPVAEALPVDVALRGSVSAVMHQLRVSQKSAVLADGVVPSLDERVRELVSNLPKRVLRCLLAITGGFAQSIVFPRASRDGGSSDGVISLNNVHCYQLVLRLALLAPAALSVNFGAPRGKNGGPLTITIRNGPLFWYIRDEIIRKVLSEKMLKAQTGMTGDEEEKDIPANEEDAEEEDADNRPKKKQKLKHSAGDSKDSKDEKESKDVKQVPVSKAAPEKRGGGGAQPSWLHKRGRSGIKPGLPGDWELKECQVAMLQQLADRKQRGQRDHLIASAPGSGKTLVLMLYLLTLDDLPERIVYLLPTATISTIIAELTTYGMRHLVDVLLPIKTASKKRKLEFGSLLRQPVDGLPRRHRITLCAMDHVKKAAVEQQFESVMHETALIVDEMHLAMTKSTQRTEVVLRLAQQAAHRLMMSGTPVLNYKLYQMTPYVQLMMDCPVVPATFHIAVQGLVSASFDSGVTTDEIEDDAPWLNSMEENEFLSLVTPVFGGQNASVTAKDSKRAIELCKLAMRRRVVQLATAVIRDHKTGVFIACHDSKEQDQIRADLEQQYVQAKDIFLIGKGQSLHLTDDAVEKRQVPDYKVVVTTVHHGAGYNLSRLHWLIQPTLPGNLAGEIQRRMRLNRIGQRSPVVHVVTVGCGLRTQLREKHRLPREFLNILRAHVERPNI